MVIWVLVLLAFLPLASADWLRFRGPNGSGVSDSTALPTVFGPKQNLLWKASVPNGRSSPVIAGDRLFVTAVDEGNLVVIAIDRKTGKTLWTRSVPRPRTTKISKHNDHASPTPVSDGTNVYVFFADFGLVSFTAEGKERWRLPLGPFDSYYGMAASPVLSGETLFLNCDARSNSYLLAVQAATGKQIWRADRNQSRFEGHATPVLYSPKGSPPQLIVLGAHRVEAYSPVTGERLWRLRGLGYFPVASPVVENDQLLVTTYGADKVEGPSYDDFLKQLDTNKDGRISTEEGRKDPMLGEDFDGLDRNSDGFLDRGEWDSLMKAGVGDYGLLSIRLGGSGDLPSTAVSWRNKKTHSTVSTTIRYRDVLYLMKGAGIVASLDPSTGKEWKVDRVKEAMDESFASPVAADGKVFFTTEAGKVIVLKAGAQWEVLSVNDLGEPCYATPAITDGTLFVRTQKALYAFRK